MGKAGKVTTLLLLAGVALLFVPTGLASENTISFPEPFVPKFTVQYVDRSYDVPTKTSSTMNPYTGEVTNTTSEGYHVEYKTVDIIIENQPIPESNTTYTLFYNIREKGHFGDDWHEIYTYDGFTYQTMNPGDLKPESIKGTCPASNSKYTIVSLKYNEGYEVDFQVQALYGYSSPSSIQHDLFASLYYSYIGGKWSDTQTITVTGTTQAPILNPTNTPISIQTTPKSNPSINTPQPTETPAKTEEMTQTGAFFFLENKNVLAFGVSCITIGVLMVTLAVSRKQSKNKEEVS